MKWFKTNPHRILITNGKLTGFMLGDSPDAVEHKAVDTVIQFARSLPKDDSSLLKVYRLPLPQDRR